MRTSENSVKWKSNFRECPKGEVRRIPIPRRWVNNSGQDSSPIHSGLLQCLVGKTIGDARRTRVRRRGLWAACVVLLLGVGVLVVGIGTGSAKDEGDEDE